MVERAIQTVKRVIERSKFSQEDPYFALLHLRTTPLHSSLSPAAHLMKRQLQTLIPAINQEESTTTPRTLPELSVAARKGVITNKATAPRSYNILTDKLTKIRRN